MKIVLFILSFLILAPSEMSHIDVVAYDNINQHAGYEMDVFHYHHLNHHQNDTDEQRKTEHHHHCINLSLLTVFVCFNQNEDSSFVKNPQEKKEISFYRNLHGNSYLDFIFQPPQV